MTDSMDDEYPQYGISPLHTMMEQAIKKLKGTVDDESKRSTENMEKRLKDQTCPQCRRPFTLRWNDYSDGKQTLFLRGCPSGGIYDVRIECPHCDYVEEL